MTDCYITLAWILKDPELRSKQYISYGLGQEKLNIEHYKELINQTSDDEDRQVFQRMVDEKEQWLNSQHFSFLQEVDVGSWSGISTREMAQECDCIDLYRFAYTPYSTCAHNVWNHVGKFNCVPSGNPLHKFIREPVFLVMSGEPSVFLNSAKYLQKAYLTVCETYTIEPDIQMPYDWAYEYIERLRDKENL